jgi:hypothetical protein
MTRFADNLRDLPSVEQIARLELIDATGAIVGVIENRPGSAGSVAVYHAVTTQYGRLDRHSAEQALQLYAEHVADARAQPGKHPNIDRLFQIIDDDSSLLIRSIPHHA